MILNRDSWGTAAYYDSVLPSMTFIFGVFKKELTTGEGSLIQAQTLIHVAVLSLIAYIRWRGEKRSFGNISRHYPKPLRNSYLMQC